MRWTVICLIGSREREKVTVRHKKSQRMSFHAHKIQEMRRGNRRMWPSPQKAVTFGSRAASNKTEAKVLGSLDSERVQAWIRSAQGGDEDAKRKLIAATMEYLVPATLAMIHNRHRKGTYVTESLSDGGLDLLERIQDDAWQVTHSACCRMVQRLNTFRGRNLMGRKASFSTWVYAIAKNELRTLLRQRYREKKRRWRPRSTDGTGTTPGLNDTGQLQAALHATEDGHDAGTSPEAVLEDRFDRELVREALEQAPLTPEQREAILMYYGLRYKQERIAQLTGVQVGTVKKRIFDGLKKLRVYVQERSESSPKSQRRA